jgi:DNA-binding beta-propeller fold protein YncE
MNLKKILKIFFQISFLILLLFSFYSFHLSSKDISINATVENIGLENPILGIYNDGNYIYVTNTDRHEIIKLNNNDFNVVARVGSFGFGGNDQFAYPSGITGDGTYLYITDTENNRIVKRRADNLSYVGEATGFNNPRGIYFDPYLNEVFVTDTDNHRVVVLDTNLVSLRQVGSFGFGGNDQFAYPSGITGGMINGRDIIFVLNTENNSIDVRDAFTLQSVTLVGQEQ